MAERVRKIAALLAADVAGYTRLMEADEERTIEALQRCRETFAGLVSRHGGREFGSVGDSLMAEFPSAVNAVRCAVDVQRTLLDENRDLPADQRMQLRIGINLGDVIEDNDSLFGEGVNVAARMQALAAEGGICLAGSAYEQVKNKLDLRFKDAGFQSVKNVAQPVQTYWVVDAGIASDTPSFWSELKRRNVIKVVAAYTIFAWILVQIALLLLPRVELPAPVVPAFSVLLAAGLPIVAYLAWSLELTTSGFMRSEGVLRQDSITAQTGRRLDSAIASLVMFSAILLFSQSYLRERIAPVQQLVSIGVLPFNNLSSDPEDEYLADSIADELRNSLARLMELNVASGFASAYFRGSDLDISAIADRLGVENILSGEIQRDGDLVRVNVELSDVRNGFQIWSQSFERETGNVLAIQSDIVGSVVSELALDLSPTSMERIAEEPTDNLEAYGSYLRAREILKQPAETGLLSRALDLFGSAIDLDPRFAHAFAGRCQAYLYIYEITGNSDDFENAESDCHRSLTLNDSLWEVRVALGSLYRASGQYPEAIVELETAAVAQPTSATPLLELARTYSAADQDERAESAFRRAIEVDPSDWSAYGLFADYLYDHDRFDETLELDELAVSLMPENSRSHNRVGLSYWQAGDRERAEASFRRSIELDPSSRAFTNLGVVAYYQADFPAAVEMQARALELEDNDHRTWGRLAEAHRFVEGETELASAAYQRAIELAEDQLRINPNDWLTAGLLGSYYAHSGKLEEAREKIDDMLRLNPDGGEAHYQAALFSNIQNNIEQTYRHLEAAVDFGFPRALVADDPDLAPLREEDRFMALVAEPR